MSASLTLASPGSVWLTAWVCSRINSRWRASSSSVITVIVAWLVSVCS